MQTPSIPHAVLRDPRASAASLAQSITEVMADIERREATVASIEANLSVAMAYKRLTMASHGIGIQTLTEQLESESLHLANTRRILTGLRAIDAARDKIEREAGAKLARCA